MYTGELERLGLSLLWISTAVTNLCTAAADRREPMVLWEGKSGHDWKYSMSSLDPMRLSNKACGIANGHAALQASQSP